MTSLPRRIPALGALAALSIAALTACMPAAEPDGMLVVRDGALRTADADCAGSGSALFLHAGAVLTVLDDKGATVLDTRLPPGRAERSDAKDYGNAPRVPTVCSFRFPAAALEDGRTYTFRVDGTEIGRTEFLRGDDGVGAIPYPLLGDPGTPSGDSQ